VRPALDGELLRAELVEAALDDEAPPRACASVPMVTAIAFPAINARAMIGIR